MKKDLRTLMSLFKMERMENITIITEGDFDAQVLKKVLEGKQFSFRYEILSASGYSSALSKAKSLLTVSNNRIILLLDSDSVYLSEINEKQSFVNSYLHTSRSNTIKVVWSIPEFEIVFLNNKKFMDKALINKDIDSSIIRMAQSSPRRFLEKMTGMARYSYYSFLNEKEIVREFFNEEGPIKEIYEFMTNETPDRSNNHNS